MSRVKLTMWVICLGAFGLSQVAIGCSRRAARSGADATASTLRVVRAKQLTGLAVLEQQGTLADRLRPLGVEVRWVEFAAGPQQLEALGAGALDIAATAESPAVFAQAAGVPLVYLATWVPGGRASALVVPAGSPARTLRDLAGKRIAYQKASVGHYLTVKALESVGLGRGDVVPVNLPPPEANVAFSQGRVDAWFIWEPFVTRAVASGVGRVLIDASELRGSRNFYSTTRRLVNERPDVLKVFLAALEEADQWIATHRHEVAVLLASELQIDVPTLELMHAKYNYGLRPITPEVIAEQQAAAAFWGRQGVLPREVDVTPGFLSRAQYAALTPASVLQKSAAEGRGTLVRSGE